MKLRNKNLSLIALSLTGVLSCGSFEESFSMVATDVKEKTIDVTLGLRKPIEFSESIKDQGRTEESDKKSDVRKTEEQEQGQIKPKAEAEAEDKFTWDVRSFNLVGKTEGHLHFKGSGIGGEVFCDVDKNAQTVSTNSLEVLTELVSRLTKEDEFYPTLEITVPKGKIFELDQLFSRKLINKFNFQQNVTTGDLTGRASGDQIAPALDEISARRAELPGGHKESFGVTYRFSNFLSEVSGKMEDILTSKRFQENMKLRELYYGKIRSLIGESFQISGGPFLGSTIELDKQDQKGLIEQFNSLPGDFLHDEDSQIGMSDKDKMIIMTPDKFMEFWMAEVLKRNKADYFLTVNAYNPMSDDLKNDSHLPGIFVEGNKRIFSKVEKAEMERLVSDPRFADLEGIVSVGFSDKGSYQEAKEFFKDNRINSFGEGGAPQ